jgi:hypothetical protein
MDSILEYILSDVRGFYYYVPSCQTPKTVTS